MGLSITNVSDVLKQLYPEGLDERLILKDHTLLPLLPRRRDFYGRNLHVPLRYGKPQGRSHTFANAQFKEDGSTDNVNSLYAAFTVTQVTDYGAAVIDGQTVRRARGGDEAQFVDMLKAEMDGAIDTLGDNLAKEAFGNSGGSRGTVAVGGLSTTSLTLANPEDIVFFEIGMQIQCSADDGADSGDALRDSGDSVEITGINEDTGVLTGGENWSNLASIAAGDHLFQRGDFASAATGLSGFIPAADPSASESFFGLDRSTSPQRLAGIRFTGTSYTLDEVWIRAQARAKRSGVKLSHFICNPVDYANVETALESRKRVIDVPSQYDAIGFEGLAVCSGGNGAIPLLADADCPVNVAYGLELDTWKWATQGDAPTTIDEDGLEIMRKANSDAYEVRVVAEHNFYTDAPGRNMRISLAS